MSRLPKTRPQHASDQRRAAARGTAPRRSAPAVRSRKAATPKPAAAGARTVASHTATSTRPQAGRGKEAPASLPRLAIDGATEVAKLPLKVTGRLTLKALDAVARGLRR